MPGRKNVWLHLTICYGYYSKPTFCTVIAYFLYPFVLILLFFSSWLNQKGRPGGIGKKDCFAALNCNGYRLVYPFHFARLKRTLAWYPHSSYILHRLAKRIKFQSTPSKDKQFLLNKSSTLKLTPCICPENVDHSPWRLSIVGTYFSLVVHANIYPRLV